jgi:hypothetical protein
VDGRTAAPADTVGRRCRRIRQDGGADGYGSTVARTDGCRTDGARELGDWGIGD